MATTKRGRPEAAVAAVKQRSSAKRDSVRAVLDRAVAERRFYPKTDIAKMAGVSRDLIDAMQAEYDLAMSKVRAANTRDTDMLAKVTTADLQVQLQTYKDLHRDAAQRVADLERKLGMHLGDLLPRQEDTASQDAAQARIAQLEAEVGGLRNSLTEAEDRVKQLERINRRLMHKTNAAPAS